MNIIYGNFFREYSCSFLNSSSVYIAPVKIRTEPLYMVGFLLMNSIGPEVMGISEDNSVLIASIYFCSNTLFSPQNTTGFEKLNRRHLLSIVK